MNDRQIALIMEIVREQLNDYLSEELAEEIAEGIAEGLMDNQPLLDDMAGAEPAYEDLVPRFEPDTIGERGENP